jgi:hypothetical protein
MSAYCSKEVNVSFYAAINCVHTEDDWLYLSLSVWFVFGIF